MVVHRISSSSISSFPCHFSRRVFSITVHKIFVYERKLNLLRYYDRQYLLFSSCPQSLVFDEVDLSDASVAESSTKNVNNSFTVSGHFHALCQHWWISTIYHKWQHVRCVILTISLPDTTGSCSSHSNKSIPQVSRWSVSFLLRYWLGLTQCYWCYMVFIHSLITLLAPTSIFFKI